MENKVLLDIIKELNDNRSKLSALFSLYNNSLLVAETNRQTLVQCYEQMMDVKNELNLLTNTIAMAKKADRIELFNRNSAKIKKMNTEANAINDDFALNATQYRMALKDCVSLKAEYKGKISELCKKFKDNITTNTEPIIIKGYKQQVKIIKVILDKIDMLIDDYNTKKTKVEEDNTKFDNLYNSVTDLITRIEIA